MMLLPEPEVPTESVQRLTARELQALAEFRKLVPPCDTVTAMWFIRARKTKHKNGIQYDTVKSSKMYNAHLEWRIAFGAERLLKRMPTMTDQQLALLNASFAPRVLESKDRSGRPVMYLALGSLDTSTLEKEGVPQDLIMRRHLELSSARRARAFSHARVPRCSSTALAGTSTKWRS